MGITESSLLIHCLEMLHYSKRRVKRAIEVLNESIEGKD